VRILVSQISILGATFVVRMFEKVFTKTFSFFYIVPIFIRSWFFRVARAGCGSNLFFHFERGYAR